MRDAGPGIEGLVLQRVSAGTVAAVDQRLGSNAAAVVFDDFIVAVDASLRPYAARLFRRALEDGYQRPVRFVCVTHYHADHTFGLAPFKDAALVSSREMVEALEGSPDWGPEALARWRTDDPEGGQWLDEVEKVMPTLLVHERLDIANRGKSLELHQSGGHTRCSIYGYVPDEKVLLAGDLVFTDTFPFAGDRTADPELWVSTLRSWLEMDIEHVIPGHGPVTDAGEIGRLLEFFERLKRNTLEALAAGRSPADIVLPSTYASAGQPWFVEKTLDRWHTYYRDRS